jgi:hypothetical protein
MHHAPHSEDIRRSAGIAPPFLSWALGEGEWSASRLCRFTPKERAPGTHLIGGLGGGQIRDL